MPWSTPTLRDVRSTIRDAITGRLPGADANVPNSVLRVLSDAMGALCHLTPGAAHSRLQRLVSDRARLYDTLRLRRGDHRCKLKACRM